MAKISKCIICREEESTITILEHCICYKCEQEIIRTDIDEPVYTFFLDRLKLISIRK